VVVIARDEDEPYVTGDEGIGDRRDGPALGLASRIARSKSVFRVANASSMLAASAATV
jgi:hypothetical protein